MLSSRKKLLIKSALVLTMSAPIVLATVVSCTPSEQESDKVDGSQGGAGNQPNNPPSQPKPPVTGPDNGVDRPEEIPIFVQKQLDQAQSLVVNNKTWSRITNFNATRDVKNDVAKDYYITPLIRRYRESFHYPSWNYNFKKEMNGWQDLIDWEYDKDPDLFGKPTPTRGIETSPMIFNERTDFKVGVDEKTGQPIFAKYNDPRFILNEIKNGKLKRHPAAKTWFKQEISSDTKAITKQFSLSANALGSTATGLYAAPGEVITLKFSQKTLDEMIKQNVKNFKITINENYWDNVLKYDDGNRMSNRYPFIQTTFTIDPNVVKANGNIFQFGSPFGGAITINTNSKMTKSTNSIFSSAYQSYDFEISGALEMLTYTDGITTKADWDAQIERIKNKEINVPAMAIDLPLVTMNIPTFDNQINKFAGVDYDKIVYPGEVAKKMNSFMFLSEFLASRDKSGKLVKLMLRFCDDIWGKGASAWGGNDQTAMPVAWAANAFLKGLEQWNSFNSNWGLFHEINHNFQQNAGLFSKRGHGETDQANMYVLSMISDHGRIRNLYNPIVERDRGGWTSWNQRTSHAWNTFEYIKAKKGKGGSEYELPTILAFQLGSFNMMQYIRNDVYNAPNSHGLDEVIQLSNAFKTNFWPAIKQFSQFWAWEDWTKPPTAERKAKLDEIEGKYPAVNFVANLFATGAYIYDQENDQFIYTNDTSAPTLAATNAPYVFDFERGINSFMDTLKWDQLTFNETTKLGGRLVQDQNHPKKLIYLPPKDIYNQIDEFDVGIIPTGQDENFVKEYRWKIKMNLVSNLPVVTMFNDTKVANNNANFSQDWDYMKDPQNYAFQAPIDVRQGIYSDPKLDGKTWQKAKVSFKFVAPEAGQYDFKIKGDSWFFIDIDKDHKENPDQLWWKTDQVPNKDFMSTSNLWLKKGESVKFDVYLTQKPNVNTLQMQAVVNENIYDMFDHITSPFADASEALLGFTYQPREVDQNLFNHNLVSGIDNTFNNVIAKDQYLFEVPGDNRSKEITQWLSESDGQNWEVWQPKGESGPFTKDLIVNFKQPQTIGSIGFNHRTSNHPEARATKIVIKDQDGNILYNDQFAKQFNDRNKSTSIINFAKPVSGITKLTLTMTNERSNGFSLNSVKFSPDSWHHLNRIVAANDPVIKYYGDDWNLEVNNVDTNISAFSPTYATTNGKYQYFETTINATGFDLVGQKGLELGRFDLYVNDQLIGTYDSSNANRLDNQILASYRADDWATSQTLKIKIVNRDDKPLRFDGLQLYGRNVSLGN